MKILKIIHSAVLILLGAVSIFMSTSVAFDWFGIREMEGNYVPFVLYTNMACGYLYLFAGILDWSNLKLSSRLLLLSLLALIAAFAFLLIHINNGGVYELKTVKAMTFRTLLTAVLTVMAMYLHKFTPEKY